MTPIGVGFGLALAGAAVLAGKAPQRAASTACVAMLGGGWALAVVTAPFAGHLPEVMLSWAGLDAICGTVVTVMWSRNPKPWLFLLALMYFAQTFCHVQFWTGHFPPPRLLLYQTLLNVLLAMQIVCASWPGAEHVTRNLLSGLFSTPRPYAGDRPKKGGA